MQLDGVDVYVDASFTDDGLAIFGRDDRNHPSDFAAWQRDLHRMTAPGGPREFRLSGRIARVEALRHDIAWLKAAYMAGFAALGYRWIGLPTLEIVRRQIQSPEEDLIPVFSLTIPDADPSTRLMLLVAAPEDFPALCVQMGDKVVLLPGLTRDFDLYGTLAGMSQRDSVAHFDFAGKQIGWPTQPLHLLDLPAVPS